MNKPTESFDQWFENYENKHEYAAKTIAKDGYELGLRHCDWSQKQLIEQGQRLNAQNQQIASLKWQLKRLGYTDNGGELMKPPIGQPPIFTKYDWSAIPAHVNWMATDEDGVACGWLVEPQIMGNAWRNHSHLSAYFYIQSRENYKNHFRGDWKQSLEKRPEIKVGARVYVSFDIVNYVIKDGNSHGELDGKFEGYGIVDRFEDGRVYGRRDDGLPFSCMLDDVKMIYRPKSANEVALEQLEYKLGVAPNDNNPRLAKKPAKWFERLYMCSLAWDLAPKEDDRE